ncbi:PfkB family carbohydrate kinase [Kribbella sp. NPDC055110]
MHESISSDQLQGFALNILEKLRSACGGISSHQHSGRSVLVGKRVHELHTSDRVVVDAALGLGLFAERYAQSGISRQTIQRLADSRLSHRRHALLENWQSLHEALTDVAGSPPIGNVPSEYDLAGTIEPAALRTLAWQLVRPEADPRGVATSVPPTSLADDLFRAPQDRGRIIVVGAAVMDAVFQIRERPSWETSIEAHDFAFSPGGHGLTQAVAAAQLGHRVSLVAAVTDDRFGTAIVNYLRANSVDTSLLKIVPGGDTPFTGVFETDLGRSLEACWRNGNELRLDPWDCDELSSELVESNAVLMTFEAPCATAERILALLRDAGDARPLTIVTPAQPYADTTLAPGAFERVDYVVAHPEELQLVRGTALQQCDSDASARQLLEDGVGSVCLLREGGCTIYSKSTEDVVQIPFLTSVYKRSATARDAFCAALAGDVIHSGEQFSSRGFARSSAQDRQLVAWNRLGRAFETPAVDRRVE